MKPTKAKKQAAIESGKKAMNDTYEKTKNKKLQWWERLAWIILAGIAATATTLLTPSCENMKDITITGPDGSITIHGAPAPLITQKEK